MFICPNHDVELDPHCEGINCGWITCPEENC